MDWANERYVRLYTRDTGDWALWPWQTRALFCLILRKVDRAGIISCGKGKLRALSKVVDMPEAEIVIAIEPLIEDGCIQFNEAGDLIVANFIEAQEVLSTPAARQRDSRERRRDMISRGLRPEQRACAIYFIQPENGGSVKIGRAEDVAKRLVQMQTSRPDKLVVVAAAPGTYEDERRLHDAFADSRDRGEWFTPVEGLTALICHVNETGHIPSDLSRFVTSHSDPIRAVPSLPNPSESDAREEPEVSPGAQSERRLKSVPPPPPSEPESGYDLARRVFTETWASAHKGQSYAFGGGPIFGPQSEDENLKAIGLEALNQAGDEAEALLRHVARNYMRDKKPLFINERHAARYFSVDLLNKYGPAPKLRAASATQTHPEQAGDAVAPEDVLKRTEDFLAGLKIGGGRS